MKLNTLHMKNWCCHENLTINFRPGLVGLIGSNGSGKSSALDAIRFAITGVSIGDGSKADNLRYGAKHGTVQLDFDHGNQAYTIKRKVEAAGQSITLPGGGFLSRTSEIDEFMEGMLNTKIDAMLNNVFVGQHQIDSILFKTNSDRLKEFQETFGLLRLADAHRSLATEMSLHKLTDGLEMQISIMSTDKASDERELQERLDAIDILDRELRQLDVFIERIKRYEQIQRTLQAIAAADKAAQEATDEVDAAKRGLAKAKSEVVDIETVYTQALCNKSQLEADWQHVVTARTMAAKLKQADADLVLAEAAVAGLAVLPKQADLQQAVDDATWKLADVNELPTTNPALEELSGECRKLEAQLQMMKQRNREPREVELAQKIAQAKKDAKTFADGTCPTCKQAVANHDPEHMRVYILDMEKELAALTEAADGAWAEVAASLRALLKDRSAALEAGKATLLTTRTSMVRHATAWLASVKQAAQANTEAMRAQAEIYSLRMQAKNAVEQLASYRVDAATAAKVETRHKAFRDLEQMVQDMTADVRMKTAALESAERRLASANSMRAGLTATNDVSEAQLDEAKAKMDEVSARTQQRSELITKIGILQAKVSHYENQLAQLRAQYQKEKKIKAWNSRCGLVRDAFHVNKLPKMLMQEYAVRLNKRMQHYLQVWEAPFKMQLNDDLAFIAEFPNGVTMSAARLSGGQKIVGSISFRLAMSDTFARNAGIIVLDEPTNHLDEANIVHLQQLLLKLKLLAGSTGRQIILVTHAAGLTGFFDHVIKF